MTTRRPLAWQIINCNLKRDENQKKTQNSPTNNKPFYPADDETTTKGPDLRRPVPVIMGQRGARPSAAGPVSATHLISARTSLRPMPINRGSGRRSLQC